MYGPSNVNSKLPVLVFIHGESYDWGTGNLYDGSILSSFGNVIVVTLNYRLGVFGFLPAIQDGTIRGNYGLMDQVAALHWIQENINEFGGNPSNITIMGHGHGAACVNLLMISPMATDLFNRVILMSGSALAPWAIATDSDIYSRHLAKLLNCPNHDNLIMVNCLRSKTAEEILRVDLKVPQHLSAFGPIVDGIVVMSHPKELVSKSYDYSSSSSSAFSHFYSPMFPTSLPYSLPLSSSASSSSLPTSSSNGFSFDSQGFNSPSTTYDLLFGITRVESPYLFTAHEERHGIDMKRRDRILRTLVRNLFDFHQQVILLTLINEYTDWSRPVEHPINLFDSLVDILGDALVVSPLIQTGDTNARLTMSSYSASQVASSRRHHHPANSMGSSRSPTPGSLPSPSSQSSSSSAAQPSTVNLSGSTGTAKDRPDHHNFGSRTFFYLFSHQSENSGFSPRLGCQHGEELSYIFGAPLANTLLGNPLGIFHTNYTRQEATLAEAVMTYWTNFVKFGDPNIWPNELDSHGDRTKGRFENVFWPQYDTITRKYLLIGMKPKVRDHYHSHRLSYWLHLVPRLQETSFNEEPIYYYKHHLLPDHESPDSYDGIVRQISSRFHPSSPSSPSSNATEVNQSSNSTRGDWKFLSSNKLNDSVKANRESSSKSSNGNFDETTEGKTSPSPSSSSSLSTISNKTQATPIIMEQNNYSTALSVTIAIGCSLLILNMLIFAGVYYQLDKAKSNRSKSSCSHLDSSNDNITCNSANNSNSGHQQHHHHLHHSHPHHPISSSTNSTSLTNVNNSNNNNSTLVDASVNGQQHHPLLHHHHHHHSDYHNKFEEGLTKDETPLLTNRSSYIIQDCGESKPDDELDLTRSTGNTDLGMALDEDKYLQQEQLQQQQDRTYQTHYLTNVNLNDSITDLNRLKSDCAKVLITNYAPRDSTTSNASTISGSGGNTLRRSPKSVLKKSSMEEPVMSVFHYSPSHHHSGCPSSTCCTSECTISTTVPTNPSIQASSIPGYVTLGRQGAHHTYHSQHPSIVYNHRALTQSELMNKGSNLMGRCEEETTA
uniref:Carboxylesterase type B domain-containing protein n=1 Tax=Tetranychus urticae TaxID=32264 RepID=T1K1T4_TETUR